MAKKGSILENVLSVWEAVLACCCGLDIHKKVVVACLLIGPLDQHPRKFLRTFAATTRGLMELRDWLKENGCTHVGAESTGVYWRPVYNVLADSVEFLLINPYHLKQIPGKKTDLQDAEWIARMLRFGLVKPSLIPPREIQELRDLCRYRKTLGEEAGAEKNRVHKVLEDANIKLASVATDIFGVSGRNMLHALVAEDLSPEAMAEMARAGLRRKIPELVEALKGTVREHHRVLLRKHLDHLCYLEQAISELNELIKGNRWLKSVVIECARAAGRTKGTYLGAFYHRIAARRGANRAAVAVGHKQIRNIYQELTQDRPYHESGEHYLDSPHPEALQRRLVKRLESLGWKVKLEPQPVA